MAPGAGEKVIWCPVLPSLCSPCCVQLCDELLVRLQPERPEDDVALVAVRLHRQDRSRPAEAGPEVVPPEVPDEPA